MSASAPPLPASMAPFLGSFREVLRVLERTPGFVLLPVEIPGPDVARALGDFLTREGRRALVIEPRRDEATWKDLVSALYKAEPEPRGVVVLVGSDPPPAAAREGLRLLNQHQRHDTLSSRLGCPLLWCGPPAFLALCREEAPDFWAIRTPEIRLADEPSPGAPEPRALEIAAHRPGAAACSLRAAPQGAAEPAAELLLRQATAERRRGHAVAAAATLGALLARPGAAPALRLRAQLEMAGLLEDGGDLAAAEASYREALALARQVEDREAEARALIGAFGIAARTGRAAEAEAPLAEARAIAERLGDRALEASAVAAQALAATGRHDAQKGRERISEAKALYAADPQKDAASGGGPGAERDVGHVDVLVVTAHKDELDAVLAEGAAGDGEAGDRGWRERRDLGGLRYYRRTLPSARGGLLVVAAAWIGEAGQRTAVIRGQHLLAELDPACLAMCGACAGDPRKVSPGDVIVADQLYSFDHGKRAAPPGGEAELFHDLCTFNLQAAWKMDAAYLARELDLSALSRARPPSRAAARRWLLHALYAHEAEGGPTPVAHPDRRRACPAWTARLKEALEDGLVSMKGGALALTGAGREKVLEERLLYPDALPADPPLRVHVGAIASFSAALGDPDIWDRLQRVVPGTLGLLAGGAALGDLAARFQRRSILMRAVADPAGRDGRDGEDGLRAFACRASAAALLAFLQQHLAPEPRIERASAPDLREPADDGERPHGERERVFDDRRDSFLDRVERVALLRDPGATVTRHRAPPPFAGALEVAVPDGRRVDVRVIGVLDRSITEELVTRYVTEVEHRFRQQDPYLRSTLVHTDPPAPPDLARSAARRGVVLKSFSEVQGLIDFGRYLAWQTERVEADPSYPPSLYVEQPAVVSLGDREKSATESALEALWRLLDAPHRRFALVLGDFGAGKTFLLRELARRMARDRHPLVPVLIELGRIEKQRSLDSLLAQHFALANEPVDLRAFRYMLAEGRIALLFDGFDELALRLTYDRALEHFDTVVQAAEGIAKVVVTSRTQHFLTDPPIKRELARRAEQLQGYRLVQLQGFGEKQIRRFLGNLSPEPAEAEARYRLLHEVKDLLGLSENPRMLGFIAKIEPDKLRQAKARTGTITAAKLYEVLVEQWLDHEHARANPPGAPRGIPRDALRAAMTALSRLLWERSARSVGLGELPESLIRGAQPADAPPLERGIVEHLLGSGSLLVRDAEGSFSFVHRSALEWLVAEAAAREVKETGDSAALGADEMSELMVDFFVSLAGRGAAAAWAQRILRGAAEGNAKDNALRVARWLAKDDGAREDGDGAERDEPDVAGVNLAGQDLSGCNLACADLRKADLTQANLWSATLVEARLAGASLGGAQLSRADLTGADLAGADLRGADLSFARLVGADLRGADLTGAQLRGAKLVGARGVPAAPLSADGAAPPRPREADAMWAPVSPCNAVAWSRLGDLLAAGHEDGSVRLWDAVTGQAIRAMHGHLGAAMSVAFSPDGLLLASGSSDNTVRLWEVRTGRAVRAFEGHTLGVRSVAWSPDGQTLASGSSDKTVRLWEAGTGRLLRTFKGHTLGVRSVAWSPDGQTLASGSSDKTVRLWEAGTGRLLRTFKGHTLGVRSVAWSPDGQTLASGSSDKTVRLWEVRTGRAVRAFEGHTLGVRSVAFSPDGQTLASGSSDKTVRLWEAGTGRLLRTFKGHTLGVRSVAFSPDGQTLASGSSDKTVRLWEAGTGRLLRTFKGHTLGVRSVAFSPDGQTLASGSSDKTVRLWRVRSGHALRTFEGHTDWILAVAWSPDGQALASGSSDRTARLWDAGGGRALRTFVGHTDWVFGVAWSADGRTLASGSLDRTVRLWEVGTGRAIRRLEGHRKGVCSVAFSPSGQTLASGSRDKTVRLWEVARGHALRSFEGHTDWVLGVACSPDGQALASGSDDKTVRLWEVGSGRAIRTFKGHTLGVRSVAFDPDGVTMASGSDDKTVRLWDVARGRLLRSFEGHAQSIRSVAFSPDGEMLASGSDDRTVRLWEVVSGGAVRTLEGHAHRVCSVAWSPAGLTLASGSDDRTLRLWEVGRSRAIRAFEGHTDGIRGVAFSPDGVLLASGSDDRTVRLWDVGSGRALGCLEGHTRGVRGVAFNPASQMLASGSSDKTVRLWDVKRGRVLRTLEGHKASVQGIAFSPDGALLASASADGTLRLWDVGTGGCLAILLPCPEGWAAFSPDGRYKLGGDIGGSFWHVIGLCRFEPGELDPYLPSPLRIPGEAPLVAHPRPAALPANGAGR
ncbi:pentapeptide repeat-containing protein [Sorangium cellulosum]|uniref:WD40 domain-containing protein n=1 Tax=Sorangium cellulosum TaxID=56 RepID=UPI0003FE1266|nr:pentapeptide repeat-containing protein [Sorangium cellulosum]